MTAPRVDLDLTHPPEVVAQGLGVHGVTRRTDEFRLPRLWSLHLYSYDAVLEVDGRPFAVTPGSVSLVPPDRLIRYRYRGPSRHLYAHLSGRRSPQPGTLSTVMYPGAQLAAVTDLMRSAVAAAATSPARTRADVWTVLLRLADCGATADDPPPRRDEHVTRALSYIEARLAEPVTVPQIAAAAGVSADHLTRLFRRATGLTVVGYLRQRRVEHAQRLLTESTMSIAAIANVVGIADLQAFNKTCRAVTGRSPRQLRSGV